VQCRFRFPNLAVQPSVLVLPIAAHGVVVLRCFGAERLDANLQGRKRSLEHRAQLSELAFRHVSAELRRPR
jgi:hypothetical protein